MKKMAKILLIGLGFGLVAAVLGLLTSKPAPAQSSTPVTVVNTPLPVRIANTPVPVNAHITNSSVPVQGTVNANITNSSVPVNGAVSVTSLPTVTLNGTSAVSLSNNRFSPVYVDNDAVATVNAYGSVVQIGPPLSQFGGGENNCTGFLPVPTGYSLVVESVSLSAQVPTGTSVQNAYFGINTPTGVVPGAYLVPTKVSTFGVVDYYVASASIRAYFTSSQSQSIGVGITTTPANGSGPLTPFVMSCTMYGHFVPV